ncbi:M57 family metalloprotease [Pedobacter sp. PF22-3]|uniref:M57 family metalloprotease n=1 Tax=Pedobacter sp. PF22-3 TaxID=2994467 RepID=UPI002246DA02|nr:M57 family metalloprotease [Pedobacter sp. PF22-3]MCX2492297.1 M57 family metalloprotease [Pedobacter sp. PF22-3]
MKRKILLTLYITAIALMFSCKKQSNIESATENRIDKKSNVPDSLQYLVRFLSTTKGVKESDITLSDTSFVIQNDVFIYKEDVKLALEIESGKKALNQKHLTLAELFSSRKMLGRPDLIQQRQYINVQNQNPWIVDNQFITNLKVKINATSPEWIDAAQEAVRNFNLNSLTSISKIQIKVVTEGQNITISETGTTNSNSSVIADAQIPRYAFMPPGTFVVVPGSQIRIYNNHGSLPLAQKVVAITHELAHTIGIAHTDGTGSDEIQIAGTAAFDASSYMNGSLSLGSFEGFTSNDLIALRTMYPKAVGTWEVMSSLSAESFSAGGSESIFYFVSFGEGLNGYLVWYNSYYNTSTSYNYFGTKIANSTDGLFYINTDHEIFKGYTNGSTPVQLPGNALEIAQSNAGVFILSTTPATFGGNLIKRWDGTNWIDETSLGAVKFGMGKDYNMAIIDNAGNFKIRRNGNSYFDTPSQNIVFKELAIGYSNNVDNIFLLGGAADANGNYQLFRWTGYDFYDMGYRGYKVGMDGIGHPWVAKKNGGIYRNLSL